MDAYRIVLHRARLYTLRILSRAAHRPVDDLWVYWWYRMV
jgi:hypothetical protein